MIRKMLLVMSLLVSVALITVMIGMSLYSYQDVFSPRPVPTPDLIPSPTYFPQQFCAQRSLYEESLKEYRLQVRSFISTNEEVQKYCYTELWIFDPNGVQRYVGSYGDTPYSFSIQNNILTFTTAVAQIDGFSWYVVDLETGAIRQQDEHPFSDN